MNPVERCIKSSRMNCRTTCGKCKKIPFGPRNNQVANLCSAFSSHYKKELTGGIRVSCMSITGIDVHKIGAEPGRSGWPLTSKCFRIVQGKRFGRPCLVQFMVPPRCRNRSNRSLLRKRIRGFSVVAVPGIFGEQLAW